MNKCSISTSETSTSMNGTIPIHSETFENKLVYYFTVPVLLTVCLISFWLNFKLLLCCFWLKKPFSSTLSLCLSLACADTMVSFTFFSSLLFNSLLPQFNIILFSKCINLFLECLKLSCILSVTIHLFVLSLNHFIGIKSPLKHMWMTTTKIISVTIYSSWFFPIVWNFYNFSNKPNEGFQSTDCTETRFLRTFKFRISFSSVFCVLFVIMLILYIQILSNIKKQDKLWGNVSYYGQHSRNNIRQKHELIKNIKAFKTTSLILGSYLIGYFPALLSFVFICDDCLVLLKNVNTPATKLFFAFINFLMILKSLANPLIYTRRIDEIQKALNEMKEFFRNCYGNRMDRRHPEQLQRNNMSNVRYSQTENNASTTNFSATVLCENVIFETFV